MQHARTNAPTHAFMKLKVPMPRNVATQCQNESIVEFLLRAHSAAPASGYEWVNVTCLEAGSVLIFRQSAEIAAMPADGYGWMDDERRISTVVAGREVEIFSRLLGFKDGEKHATIKRLRYRLSDPAFCELNLVHYLPLGQHLISPVFDHLIKEIPAPMPLPQGTNTPGMNPQMMAQPNMNQQNIYQQQQMQQAQARKNALIQQQQLQQQKDIQMAQIQAQQRSAQHNNTEEDAIGDITTNHQIAIERLKRNLCFIEEIFSPYSLSNITASSILPNGITIDSMEALQAKLNAKQEELDNIKTRQNEDLATFQAHSVAMWNCISSASDNSKDVQQACDKAEILLGHALPHKVSMRRHEVSR